MTHDEFERMIAVANAAAAWVRTNSERPAQDCVSHALVVQNMLEQLGIPSEVVLGEAAWRYGKEDGAVIAHMQRNSDTFVVTDGNFSGHAWAELTDGTIVDATLWSIPDKVGMLQSLDGRDTTNLWSGDSLVVHSGLVADFKRVRDGYSIDAYYKGDWRLTEAFHETLLTLGTQRFMNMASKRGTVVVIL